MANEDMISCAVCGASNPATSTRCSSCGARLEELSRELSEDEEHARRYQQDTFEWKWVIIAFVLDMILGAIVFIALPLVIPVYDPQGAAGLLIAGGVWFVGAIIVGRLSPGKTFLEPPVGALLAVLPTLAYLDSIADVRELPKLAYIVGGLLGILCTLMGAFIGEKLQPPSTRKRA
jgi:hypothetical protein